MNVKDAIRTRHAVRQFRPDPIPDEVLEAILNAGRRSQSSKNRQWWQFIVIKDRERLKALSTAGDFAQHLIGAPLAIALVGTQENPWNAFDLGQVAALMQLEAHELGIGSCIANFHRPDEARAILGVPADHYVMGAISFGYPASDYKPSKMGGRKPLDEVVHWEKW
ncbi:MAG: nitroreductase family protein [Anaerolineae bacterium]|nr:nitroreductase family protein [Anaerolineae bacterium]